MTLRNWMEYCLIASDVHPGNRVELLGDGEQAFPAMLEALEKARRTILLEVYSFGDDSVGLRFREVLERKAGEGIQVFVIYDAVGSIGSSRSFFEHMASAGVQVAEYHPLEPWKPHWNWLRRNHRKILLVDEKICFVGGANLNADDAPASWGGRGWKNVQVRLEGGSLGEVALLFWESWKRCGLQIPPGQPEPEGNMPPSTENAAWTPVAVVSVSGLRNRRSIRRSYKYAIDKAKDFIYITNAYFLPGRTIYRRLVRAARRGVKVAIITPSQTDHPYVRWAAWSLYGLFIKAGIEIHEWMPSVLHSKTAVIDGVWSSVGSHNLDHRSLHFNLEINTNILGPDFGERMKAAFEKDLRHCRKVTLDDWKGQKFLFKVASRILYWMRYWL
ncbi:MAG: phosphatidylserine/phosphatidylglycerophosphate/cardiolipin synthase family protein [bacterium]